MVEFSVDLTGRVAVVTGASRHPPRHALQAYVSTLAPGKEVMMSRLGDRLRSAREQRQQSLERIAVRLGLPESELAAYEAGAVVPDRLTLLRLERVLGLPIGWLTSVMREPDPEPPPPR